MRTVTKDISTLPTKVLVQPLDKLIQSHKQEDEYKRRS